MITLTVTFQGMTFTDRVMVSVVEPNLGVNNSNSTHDMDENTHDDLRPGVSDVDFEIDVPPGINATNEDRRDEMVEDQGEGFPFWWSRDPPGTLQFSGGGLTFTPSPITEGGIVDLAPLIIYTPQLLLSQGFKFHLETSSSKQFWVYRAVSPANNRRAFLQSETDGTAQKNQTAIFGNVVTGLTAGTNEFVFKMLGSGTEQIKLSLLAEDKGGNKIAVDSVRLTFTDSTNYWLFVSTRGNPIDNFNYPIDDGQFVSITRYPSAQVLGGTRDPAKTNHVIWVHGYNVSEDAARNTYNEMHRRLYWLGFRGNFVGLTWHSNEGQLLGIPIDLAFDTEVQNAFQTSPSVWRFLRDDVRVGWGVPADNVNLVAHSLGNLVVFDALRLHRRLGAGHLVRNAIGFESATWPEAYRKQKNHLLDPAKDDPILTNPPGYEHIYTVDQLKQQSWAFWFRQAGYEVPGSLAGAVYHSYLPDDRVLFWMRRNDYLQRSDTHYYRHLLERSPAVYRAPEGLNNLYDGIPTLMRLRHRRIPYGWNRINLPVGTTNSVIAVSGMNYLATDGNWRPGSVAGIASHSGYLQWYPEIYKWYAEFLGDALNPISAIPLGEE
jgi:hypothetical protein